MPSASKKTSQQPTNRIAEVASGDEVAQLVGRWNGLVSTTNWEKGRIICQWRETLMASGADASEYADEAWAQLVGGVTGQHVGRLRRVYQQFGDVYERYEGIYWSHFHAGIDWEDAEMWLEGAVQNGWSVSQMRGKRWETLGTPGEEQPEEEALLDEPEEESVEAVAEEPATVRSATPDAEASQSDTENEQAAEAPDATGEASEEAAAPASAEKRTPLGVDVDELPDDLAEAFEQFKLAIIANRRGGWKHTSPKMVVECLDALKQLALAEDR